MFEIACCRCVAWPFLPGRAARFPDPKLVDEDNEEQARLLDSVLDSDDEQADALSSDQIKRYLDESRARGKEGRGSGMRQREACGGSTSSRGSSREMGPGQRGTASSSSSSRGPALIQMDPATSRDRSTPLVDEYDDLFDEELDEPDNVVVGAKPRLLRPADNNRELVETNAAEARRREASLADWIDMSEEEPDRELRAVGSFAGSNSSRASSSIPRVGCDAEALGVLPAPGAFASFGVDRSSPPERSTPAYDWRNASESGGVVTGAPVLGSAGLNGSLGGGGAIASSDLLSSGLCLDQDDDEDALPLGTVSQQHVASGAHPPCIEIAQTSTGNSPSRSSSEATPNGAGVGGGDSLDGLANLAGFGALSNAGGGELEKIISQDASIASGAVAGGAGHVSIGFSLDDDEI